MKKTFKLKIVENDDTGYTVVKDNKGFSKFKVWYMLNDIALRYQQELIEDCREAKKVTANKSES